MSKNCENCIYYENKVSDEYYDSDTGDYHWWWYDFCNLKQRTIEDTFGEVCHHYEELKKRG